MNPPLSVDASSINKYGRRFGRRTTLRQEDNGKFVAIDVETGDYEMDLDDSTAILRLRARKPQADTWLMRASYPTTCRTGVR